MPEINTTEETIFDHLGDRPQVAALIDWTLLKLDKQSDSIHLSFTATEAFTNPAGTVHGGFIVAMLDECMGSAIVGLTDARFLPMTISMSTDFIKPVLVGTVFGEGHITSMGNSSAFLEARLSDGAGRTLARAIGTYRLLPFPHGPNHDARPH
ncbi:PaaI family thioesterase [Actinoallomurus liliacearum]|uniref:PaaI family thioesterase n=1 Tax=Actinoallomurus liliacearum TaxID=1080073 RepID=A0ABP8TE38_9ACTN